MTHNEKQSRQKAAESASDVLQDGRTSKESKSAAGSALSQSRDDRREEETGRQSASAASDVLQNEDTGKKSKSAAGSALSNKQTGDER